jgi:hypothetical protein
MFILLEPKGSILVFCKGMIKGVTLLAANHLMFRKYMNPARILHAAGRITLSAKPPWQAAPKPFFAVVAWHEPVRPSEFISLDVGRRRRTAHRCVFGAGATAAASARGLSQALLRNWIITCQAAATTTTSFLTVLGGRHA